jgi:RimJ/RimL family protein N-acetyltransferase
MIVFTRTHDLDIVQRVLTHPKIYDHISDDLSPDVSQYRPPDHPAMWYVLVHDLEDNRPELLGCFVFHPQNGVCWEVHTALLPNSWGERAHEAADLLPEWIWTNTPCRRIVTNVPTTNRLALAFAIRAGMRIYGINEASYLKNGMLCDQVCLGISQPDAGPRIAEAESSRSKIDPYPIDWEDEEETCRQR